MIASILENKLGRRVASGPGRTGVESADQILDRVAATLGRVEARYGASERPVSRWTARFRALMEENRFWPSGRILNNCGARQGQLASCFVLPLPDDFRQIFDTLAMAALCHRTGGGTGFDLSEIRERGAPISSAEAAGASGPVSWLRLFDAETAVTMQGGKMRGANLASLSVRHPDIFLFLDAKATVGNLSTFNISVAADDDFMRAVADDQSVDLVSPTDGRVTRRVPAVEIWDRLTENAWRTGDPGVLFTDTINRANPLLRHLGPIRTTNPCGEQTLYPYEASNLGSVNLAVFRQGAGVDWSALEQTVADATRLLDNAIDASQYPDPRILELATANRRLGLGVMGFADLLVGLGIPYDSPAALGLIDEIGTRLQNAAWAASRALAAEREPFPNWINTGWCEPTRNCAVTTIAPTGTISMVAGCSSGIEPRFAPVWNKDVLTDNGIDHVDRELVADVVQATGRSTADAVDLITAKPLDELSLTPETAAKYRYAHDISPAWHVNTAARWQRYVDNAVSKTVNLSAGAELADAAEVFRLSWELGCKGTSLYREGSRDRDLLERRTDRSAHSEDRQSRGLMAGLADMNRGAEL